LAQSLEQDLFYLAREGGLIREQVGQVFHTFVSSWESEQLRMTHDGVGQDAEPPGLMQAIVYAQMTGQVDLHINVLREWAISLSLANRHSEALRFAASACDGFHDQMEAAARRGHAQAEESYRYWGLDTAKRFTLTDQIGYFDALDDERGTMDSASAYDESARLLDQGLRLHLQGRDCEALALFQEALAIARRFQPSEWAEFAVGAAYYDIGNCYSRLGPLDRAVWYYNAALAQFEAMGHMDSYCEVVFNLGCVYAKASQMAKAKDTWERCVELGMEYNPHQATKAVRHLQRFGLRGKE
jgi:tetratricopeptide (TPR) repeat protein